MIKTIDDLRKCYAVRADKEVFELFMNKCEEFGVVWSGSGDQPRDIKSGEAVVFSGFDKGMLTHDRFEGMQRKDYKRLTLSDFKRTQTEYVQVTESIFDLRDEFERGELYFGEDEEWKINDVGSLADEWMNGNVYRRVEKEVDWRDEAHKCLSGVGYHWSTPIAEVIKDESDYFLELCRVALRANGEIE